MNKIIVVLILFFFNSTFSQSPLQIGEIQANGGLIFNNIDGLPIYAGADYGIAEKITIGAKIAPQDLFTIAVNGNYHFDELLTLPSEWNVYSGLTMGLISGDGSNFFDLGIQSGARYFFAPSLAGNIEFGGGTELSGGQIGVTYLLR